MIFFVISGEFSNIALSETAPCAQRKADDLVWPQHAGQHSERVHKRIKWKNTSTDFTKLVKLRLKLKS